MLLSYRLEDDYGVTEAQATFARKRETGDGDRRIPSTVRRTSRWSCRKRAPRTASARPSKT